MAIQLLAQRCEAIDTGLSTIDPMLSDKSSRKVDDRRRGRSIERLKGAGTASYPTFRLSKVSASRTICLAASV